MNKEAAVLENRISELEDVASTQAHELDQANTTYKSEQISDPLYRLVNEYESALLDLTAMIGTEDEQFALDTLEGLKGTLEVKSANVGKFIKRLDGFGVALDTEIKRLQKRKERLKKTKDWFKNYLKMNMERANIKKIETDLFVLMIVKNPPKVIISDEKEIPSEFQDRIESSKINKKRLSEELKFNTVPGAQLIQETRLEIK